MLDSIESQIFSLVKAKFPERVKKKYPDLNFTTSDKSATKPKFPTEYIHLMNVAEVGETLDGLRINAVDATFQVDVSDNQSQARADEVARETLKIMKSMRFKAVTMPFHNNAGNVYRTTARYRRVIGAGDII